MVIIYIMERLEELKEVVEEGWSRGLRKELQGLIIQREQRR